MTSTFEHHHDVHADSDGPSVHDGDPPAGRLWPAVVGIGLVVAAAVIVNAPDRWVPDNRFDYFWAPTTVLRRHLWLWDATRGLGRAGGEFHPALLGFMAGARAIGLSPMAAEKALHIVLITGGAAGVIALLRLFRPKVGPEHVIAGLAFAFNPFSLTFLIPSSLYMNYVLAPWFALVVARGVRAPRGWRWPAVFSLLVFVAGALNYPGLAYALVPAASVVLYLVVVDRDVTAADVARWCARAALLAVGVSLAAAVKTVFGAEGVAENLATTESPRAVNATSSWSESWRGLGFWLSYFTTGRVLNRPAGRLFFTSPAVVFASFAAPCAALLYVSRSRWRPRLLFAGSALAGLVLMVGSYGADDSTPFGRLLLRAMELPYVAGFRNSYKAGPALMIGVAVLFASGVVVVADQARQRWRAGRFATYAATVAVIVAASLPAWVGELYAPGGNKGLPSYWHEAGAWLDAQPGDDRVWLAPGGRNARYRWGDVGDDVADALFERPHVNRGNLRGASAEAGSLISALDDEIRGGTYRSGAMGPIARRIGVRWVLVRYDLDWQRMSLARPAALGSLRDDPDLRLVKSFGAPGQNVVAAGDHTALAAEEGRLRPIEIYEVRDAVPTVRLVSPGPPLLLAGDGAGWPTVARQGLLDSGRPIRHSGALTTSELGAALRAGAPLLTTDSNRRRRISIGAQGETFSPTLTAEETVTGPGPVGGPGSQSVAWHRDALRIFSPTHNSLLDGGAAQRAANAFDGLETTAWLAGAYRSGTGQTVRVDFRRPVSVSEVRLQVSAPEGGRRVTGATVLFSDGSSVPVDLRNPTNSVVFPTRTVRWAAIRVDSLSRPGISPFGFTEIEFPGIDLREFVQVPDDVMRRAEGDTAVAARLGSVPLVYAFDRAVGPGGRPDEAVLRRRFRVDSQRVLELSGITSLSATAGDEQLDVLLGREVGAVGSERHGPFVSNSGVWATDGRLDTGWTAPPATGATLRYRFPEQRVERVRLALAGGPGLSSLTRLLVHAGGGVVEATVPAGASCMPAGASTCTVALEVAVPPVVTGTITVEVAGIDPRRGGGFGSLLPVQIAEVDVGGENPGLGLPLPRCGTDVVTIDGRPEPVTLEGRAIDLLAGRAVQMTGCAGLELGPGWHHLEGGLEIRADAVVLSTKLDEEPSATAATAQFDRHEPTHLIGTISAPRGGTLVIGQSFDPGWSASIAGRDLGPAISADGMTAWTVPAGTAGTVDVRFRSQRLYGIALWATGAMVLLSLVLSTRRSAR